MVENPGVRIEGTLHSVGGNGVVRLTGRYETDVDDVWSALTDPQRLARWYGKVDGDLSVGGEFTAIITGSGWEGRGRIDICVPPRQLRVTMAEDEGPEDVLTAELVADGDHTILIIQLSGLPLDRLYAYAAGEQTLMEDLGAHLAGLGCADWPTRWKELAASYRAMTVVPLEG